MDRRIIIEKELLEQLYLGNDYSISEIAEICNCSIDLIFNRLRESKIPKKYYNPWNKGMENPYSAETLKRMSETKKEMMKNPEDHPFYGKHHTIETRKKLSEKCGHPAWNKGLKGFRSGEINNMWKGADASYSAIHKYIQCHKPKSGECESCGKSNCRLELANLSGEYKRDINDYKYMCVKCHREFDDTMPRKFLTPKKDIKELSLTNQHRRLRTQIKHNGFCEFCEKKTNKLDLANLSGLHLPYEEDYIYLCRKCHAKFDKEKGYNNLKDFI